MKFFAKAHALLWSLLYLVCLDHAYCQTEQQNVKETVLKVGKNISFPTKTGNVTISAMSGNVRELQWDGIVRKIECVPRPKRWYGKLGIYNTNERIKSHNGISRVLYEEAVRAFDSKSAALDWLRQPFNSNYLRYNKTGLAIGWLITPEREQLSISVLQIVVRGKIPSDLPGGKLTGGSNIGSGVSL